MSHMPEGLLHEQAEAVFKETGMGPRQLRERLDAAKQVIEGAVDVNLELQVRLHKLREACQGLLSHACIADAAPEDVDEEDRALERVARQAIARAIEAIEVMPK
jgi:hypothetical protein